MDNLIIVAHPDDEIIWFSSFLKEPETCLIICFDILASEDKSQVSDSTNKVLNVIKKYAEYLPVIWLRTPKTTSPKIFGQVDTNVAEVLFENIKSIINTNKPKYVFTHNPWGEYGHSEHKLVYKIVAELRPDLIFPDATIDKALESEEYKLNFNKTKIIMEKITDVSFKMEIERLYRKNNIWTMKEVLNYPLTNEKFRRFTNG